MARKVKFPLIMADGTPVRNPDELKMHFDLPAVMEYYANGKLAEWLDNCLYTEEAARVRELRCSSAPDLGPMLCDILGVAYTKPENSEEALDRHKRLAQLRQYTADENILAAVDHAAFSQEDLVRLLEKEPDAKKIYLCGERFAIAGDWKGVTYIGLNHPQVYIRKGLNGITVEQVRVSSNWQEFKPEQLWRSLAEQGNATAQNELGNCFYAAENYQEAFAWYMRAAEQGNVEAQYNLAVCYRDGKGVDADQEESFKWFLSVAEQGDAYAQWLVGNCYYIGNGIAQNYKLAFQWYWKAAEQGNVEAQYNLAKCYRDGKGADADQEESFKWFLRAAKQGNDYAQCLVGNCYYNGNGTEQNYKLAFQWYWKAAEQGVDWAQYMLAVCYRDGKGVDKAPKEAFKWFLAAAEWGNANAQNQIGLCYLDGQGVEQDLPEAFTWFMRAAEQGHAEAQYNMAECYLEGWGVPTNDNEAVIWLQKACDQDIGPARYKLLELVPKRFGLAEVLLYAIGGEKNLLPEGAKINRSAGTIQLMVDQRFQVREDILRKYGAKDVQVEPVYYEDAQEPWWAKNGELIGGGVGVLLGGPFGAALGGAAAHAIKKTLKKSNMVSPKYTAKPDKTRGTVYVVLDKIDAEMEAEFNREIVR